MSMLADIKKYLVDNGFSETIKLSAMEDNYSGIALYQYAGQEPMYFAGIERPGLQVKARYSSYETAMSHLKTIEGILLGLGDEYNDTGEYAELNGTKYHRIVATGSAESLGWNQGNKKVDVIQNFYVMKEF